jgi:AraC-like DNA-binding protein
LAAMHAVNRSNSRYPSWVHFAAWKPILDYFGSLGVPVSKYMDRHKLPLHYLDEFKDVVPLQRVIDLVADVARAEYIENVGHESIRYLSKSGQEWQFSQSSAPTLFTALQSFSERLRTQTTTDFRIQDAGNAIRYCRKERSGVRDDECHAGWFAMEAHIKLVQSYAGKDWEPKRMGLPYDCSHNPWFHRNLPEVKFEPTHSTWWLEIDRKFLGKENPRLRVGAATENPPDLVNALMGGTLSEALGRVLRTYLADKTLSVEEAAELFNVSSRSLQRRLANEGTSYSSVVEYTKLDWAKEMLEQTNHKVIDIGISAGYANPACFSRAFRRYTGVSPIQHRQHFSTV